MTNRLSRAFRLYSIGQVAGIAAALILFVFTSVAAPTRTVPPIDSSLAIQHVTLIDATGALAKPDMTVVIQGDKIAAIGKHSSIHLPPSTRIIDGTNKFLIPGLWDMHAHTGSESYLALYTANGITGIRDMGADPDEFERLQHWNDKVNNGELIGPYIVKAGIMVDGPASIGRPHSLNVATADEARAAVDTLKQKRADFVKVYSMLPRHAYFAISDEAKRQHLAFAGHLPFSVSAEEASEAGQRSMEHLFGVITACSSKESTIRMQAMAAVAKDGYAGFVKAEVRSEIEAIDSYSPRKASALFRKFVRNRAWQVPTLVAWRNMLEADNSEFTHDKRLRYVSLHKKEGWKAQSKALLGSLPPEFFTYRQRLAKKQFEIVAAMQRAGVGLLAGTDTATLYVCPGFGLHDELGLLVKAGLTPMQALQAATRNPAEYLGLLASRGTVETGKVADLVLLNANPLKDIANTKQIDAVVLRGRFLSKTKLTEMLDAVAAQYSTPSGR